MQQKGAVSLTNAELLQVIIGSGNAQASVARISKRVLKVLTKEGSEISFDRLLNVAGLGPARVCQIIAVFELASRYPMPARQLVIDSVDKALGIMAETRAAKQEEFIYVTVDGGQRFIAKRKLLISETTHPSSLLKKVFADAMIDNAAGLYVGSGRSQRALDPTMFDLSLARDLRAMAQLFMLTVHAHVLLNKDDHYIFKRGSW